LIVQDYSNGRAGPSGTPGMDSAWAVGSVRPETKEIDWEDKYAMSTMKVAELAPGGTTVEPGIAGSSTPSGD
jgi:hypothetical protein